MLPIRLAPGIVSLYSSKSIQGFEFVNNTMVAFGVINQMADTEQSQYSVGQNVLIPYKEADEIIYGNQTYWLLPENKIIFTEDNGLP